MTWTWATTLKVECQAKASELIRRNAVRGIGVPKEYAKSARKARTAMLKGSPLAAVPEFASGARTATLKDSKMQDVQVNARLAIGVGRAQRLRRRMLAAVRITIAPQEVPTPLL